MPLPTFLILGAQKSGTRWLRHNLGMHRAVHVAEREVEFFNHEYERGSEWYSAQFDCRADASAIGEATPGYMFHLDDPTTVAARIHDTLGADVALIAILRDPVERARSSYVHHLRRERIDPDIDPVDHLRHLDPHSDPLGIVSGGWYGRSLAPYHARFERLSIEFHRDIEQEGEALYLRALRHIGVDDPWIPEHFHDVRHSGVEVLNKRLPDHPILSISHDELREVLMPHFADDLELIESMTGRAVPWRNEVS